MHHREILVKPNHPERNENLGFYGFANGLLCEFDSIEWEALGKDIKCRVESV